MDVIEEMYGRWAAGTGGGGDHWGDVTGEPGGLDYLEVSAAGVPAMWLSPPSDPRAPAGIAAVTLFPDPGLTIPYA